ncbi:hypothetical protein FGADI_11166 [Fusarium gaditjirri]|uniref:Uncharacterized protein n=1 Tax=Fusarium gaditjirri TaxID=282569 RepID=A0A8H4SVL1_9HYPO|nr:hypothetical protein FGADI_11166 [Fusarium gaditjirri]
MASTSSTPASTEPRVITGWKRVAWPKLRTLPLEMSVASLPAPMQQVSQDILKSAHTIAKKHQLLSPEDTDAQIRFEMRKRIPTLLIVAPWSSEKTPIWEAAVQDMAMSLAELTKASMISEGDIHIEIIAPELTQTIYYTWPDDRSLCRNWDSVSVKVYNCLQSFEVTKGYMSTISFQHYGVLPDLKANPLTIYIGVDNRSDETGWHEVIADIRNILQGEVGWGHVQIHMEHNENWGSGVFD